MYVCLAIIFKKILIAQYNTVYYDTNNNSTILTL